MNTKTELLNVARDLIQRVGYAGFSYADLASAVGIRKASIHYHFPKKEDLGKEVAIGYHSEFMKKLRELERKQAKYLDKIKGYIRLFRHTLEQDHKVCLCMMFASDDGQLPDVISTEVNRFFKDNESWLANLLDKGREEKEFAFEGKSSDVAQSILAAFEGTMMIAHSTGEFDRLRTVSGWILNSIVTKP